ncbi:hypothetical protein L915_16775 [Phytophthora nicotianae]|uniref:Uncharacterized protein n=2 Tax=Phytophthora nicotianae TaxID=4792 RepID=W2G3P6_PHYNI|nr:hypothetical protein L915_16775 [Phytophthora nicotianae]
MVAKGTRAAKGLINLWATDRGTFPVVLLVGFAMTAAIGNGVRHLINNPDVCLTKSKRGNSMHYDEGQGTQWQAQRSRFANMDLNPVNRSRQENQMIVQVLDSI